MTHRLLTAEQVGHLRHFDNLSRQQVNDLSLMQGKGVGQEDFGGYRFQLAYMTYALALTHLHRLPAAPGLFQPIIKRLIDKILLPEVWLYWRDVSRGGAVFNAHITDRLEEEWNPVVRDNIMYSAYVQSMSLLHDYLFNSGDYAAPGSLTFRHWSYFWGGEEKRFEYDRQSLSDHIYWQMVENGYLGVACEPNCIFQICNQPAILGFRLSDLLTGTHRADEVINGYLQAWSDFGLLDDDGHYNVFVMRDPGTVVRNEHGWPWTDAWLGTLLNMWHRDFVHQHYADQIADWLKCGPGRTLYVPSAEPREVMGQAVVADSTDFGWVSAWASEMGDHATLDGLLDYADTFLSPTWRDGGLFYPRNDELVDNEGNRVELEPMTGNVLLGYARLNIEDGLWKLFNQPWSQGHFTEPALTAVARDVDVLQAEVIDGALITRLHRRSDLLGGDGCVTIDRVLHRGAWLLRADGSTLARIDADGHVHAEDHIVYADNGSLTLHTPRVPTTFVVQPVTEQSARCP